VWFPSHYGDLVGLEPVSWLVLVRNVALVALFVLLFRELRAAEGGR
jgi:hypothetical protein